MRCRSCSTLLLVGFNSSQDVLGDSITALGFAILFYYGFTGLACAVYFRKELVKSWKHFLASRRRAARGFGLMAAIFVKAFHDYSQPDAGYAKPLFGIQIPIVIGIGSLLLGVPLMLLCASSSASSSAASRNWPQTVHSTRNRDRSPCISSVEQICFILTLRLHGLG